MIESQSLLELANALEAKRWELMLEGDTQGLAGLISDDLLYVHSSGLKDGKQQYLDAIQARAVIYHSAEYRIEAVVPLADQALIANGIVKIEATVHGTQKSLHSIFMVVWRCEQGIWRLVAHQTTLLPA